MPFTTIEQIAALREKARELLQDGTLPPAPHAVFAGLQQRAEPCAVCTLPILPQQIGYEVDVEMGGQKRALHVHPNCHAAWEVESPRSANPLEDRL